MVSQAWIDAQPKTYNYLRVNAFRLVIHPLPRVSYFAQSCNIPGLRLGAAVQPTPLHDLPLVGDKIDYEDFSMTFIISEDMENWAELYNWMVGLGFPDSNAQFLELRESGQMKRLTDAITPYNEESGVYADATLFALDEQNNTKVSFKFVDLFPVALSEMNFTATENETQYLSCRAEFKYKGLSIDIP